MARYINLENAGKDRTRLVKTVSLALGELVRQADTGDQAKDLAAYISIALRDISETIDASVAAWEKRGYWVKADRFRLDWEWTARQSDIVKEALLKDDWASIARACVLVAQKLGDIKVSPRNRLGEPWQGAYARMVNGKK